MIQMSPGASSWCTAGLSRLPATSCKDKLLGQFIIRSSTDSHLSVAAISPLLWPWHLRGVPNSDMTWGPAAGSERLLCRSQGRGRRRVLRMQDHSGLWTPPNIPTGLLRAASEGAAGTDTHDKHSDHIFGGCLATNRSVLTCPIACQASAPPCRILWVRCALPGLAEQSRPASARSPTRH